MEEFFSFEIPNRVVYDGAWFDGLEDLMFWLQAFSEQLGLGAYYFFVHRSDEELEGDSVTYLAVEPHAPYMSADVWLYEPFIQLWSSDNCGAHNFCLSSLLHELMHLLIADCKASGDDYEEVLCDRLAAVVHNLLHALLATHCFKLGRRAETKEDRFVPVVKKKSEVN